MDDLIEIYKLNAQSADKLDERRDSTIRAYGGMCVVFGTTAVGVVMEFPNVAAGLCFFLIFIGFGWIASLHSLNAKLTAKRDLLIEVEEKLELAVPFLYEERKKWESQKSRPHQRSLRWVPYLFIMFGLVGLALSLALVDWSCFAKHSVQVGIAPF